MRKTSLFILGLFFFGSGFVSTFAHALSIIDKPLDPAGYGFTSMYGSQNVLEDFIVSAKTRITDVSWYGLFSSGTEATDQCLADFDVLFFNDDDEAEWATDGGINVSGLPARRAFYETTVTAVKGSATASGDPLHGGAIFKWETDIPTVLLDADRYWIDIRSSNTETDFFLWSHSAAEDGYAVHKSLPASYIAPYGIEPFDPEIPYWIVSDEFYDEQAFALNGVPVPEPFTIILLVFGLAGLSGFYRVRDKGQS
jgi:hypothetical protein